MSEADVRDVLRLYFDAIVLAEPAQLALWQSAELTLTQLGALSKLRAGPLPAGKLADQLGISPTSLTRVLDRLEARGLVGRHRDDPDRRRISIHLLPAGRELVDSVAVLEGSRIHDAVRAMSSAERDELLVALGRLVDMVHGRLDPAGSQRP
jgi:DNA-binding MarR family transcriptional regulator